MPENNSAFSRALQLGQDLASAELNFLRTEIALGMTFLDTAEASEIAETRRRNRAHAQKAHDEVVRRMAVLSKAERLDLEAALLPLTQRLKRQF